MTFFHTVATIQMMQSALDAAPEGIAIFDKDGLFTYANPLYATIYGYETPKVFIGKHWQMLYNEHEQGRVEQQVVPILEQQGRWRGILKGRHQDGSTFTKEIALSRMDDGSTFSIVRPQRMAGDLAVMTPLRVRFEELIAKLSITFINLPAARLDTALQEALGEVSSFIGADRAYVFQLSEDRAVIQCTHRWGPGGTAPPPHMHEFPVVLVPWLMQQLDHKTPFEITSPAMLPAHAEVERQALEQGGVASCIIAPMVYGETLTGYIRFDARLELHVWPADSDTLLERVAEIFSNVLERRRVETVLISAKEQAEEAARIKSAFLANMSHEIRTPLTSILGFSSLLADEMRDTEHLEYIQLIQQSGQRLMETLNSVLDLAQLESRGRAIHLGVFDLNIQAEEIARLLRPLAVQAGLYLEVNCHQPEALAEVDQACLHRILNNLIGNAVKFTEEGGVTVEVDADGEQVYLKVIDTGIGMEDDFLPRMFDEFRQESGGLTRSYEGSGLGLTITRRLVDLMGGTITVNSVKGIGSTFTVAFAQVSAPPRYDETFEPREAKDDDVLPRILVVEDNWETRMLFEHMLRSTYHIDTVGRPDEAIQNAADHEYDAVLMDINLGGQQTGIDVLHVIRQLTGHGRTPVIALTAYALPGDRERFLSMGFDGYLGKPFARKDLVQTIERALRRKAAP